MVDSVNGIPAPVAARALKISPSPNCMPQSPIGANASGAATFCPNIVVAVLRVGNVNKHALAQLDCFQLGPIGAERFLAIGAAVGVFKKSARNPAARKRAQVLDAGNRLHVISSGARSG